MGQEDDGVMEKEQETAKFRTCYFNTFTFFSIY